MGPNILALVPPFRFCTVEDQLYRGGYPTLKNFRFLRRLRLKTIISVIPETPTYDLAQFCKFEKIQLHHFEVEKFSDSVTISPTTTLSILDILLEKSNYPLYIHCLDGSNVTGELIMILRKLQHWDKSAITSEFCRFSRDHTIEKSEVEFLSSFSEEVNIPLNTPEWLWIDYLSTDHASVKLSRRENSDTMLTRLQDASSPLNESTSSLISVLKEGNDATSSDSWEPIMPSHISRTLEALDLGGFHVFTKTQSETQQKM